MRRTALASLAADHLILRRVRHDQPVALERGVMPFNGQSHLRADVARQPSDSWDAL
jgi:hypothetical protein